MSGTVHPFRPGGGDDGRGLRPMPHSLEAEQGLLGAILANNRAFDAVAEILRPQDFHLEFHQVLFDTMMKELADGRLVDAVTLRTKVESAFPLLGPIEGGGMGYLVELAKSAISLVNAAEYGRVIAAMSKARRLRVIGDQLAIRADGSDTDSLLQWLDDELIGISDGRFQRGFRPLSEGVDQALEIVERAHKAGGAITGLSSGLSELDRMLGGLHAGNLVVLAGRPGMGKSAIAFAIAANVASGPPVVAGSGGRSARVALFSLEMSSAEIATRLIAAAGDIEATAIRKGRVHPFERVIDAARKVREAIGHTVFVNESPAPSIGSIRAAARRLARRAPLDLVIIDHMQLITGGETGRFGNRASEMAEISAGCKAIAKELSCPVIALSQLNRGVEGREDKRPQLADLRESGSIEQDADAVVFAFRRSYYLEKLEPLQGDKESKETFTARLADWHRRCQEFKDVCQLLVSKNRHGPEGSAFIQFDRFTQAVRDFPAGRPPPSED